MAPLQPSAVILCGPGQSGKTTLLSALVYQLRKESITVAGILAVGLWEKDVRSGFNLLSLADGSTVPLSHRIPDDGLHNGVPFVFYQAGVEAGMKALSPDTCMDADVVIVDEVGFLELQGKGWASCLPRLLEMEGVVHVWAVRRKLLDEVRAAWDLAAAPIVSVEETDALDRLKTACMGGMKQTEQGS
jgi:nucleoside-triphosphatase THEP1